MGAAAPVVSDMLVTVKARELQRALIAEMQNDALAARRHFLAAAHLELVLAADYEQAGDADSELRSRISAASCLWRAGDHDQAEAAFASMLRLFPNHSNLVQSIVADLKRSYPLIAS
jgi:tetratricopeptide (TPR) repeat protein